MVLSLVSNVFDLIDLLAPFTVSAQLLKKEICRASGQHWIEEIPKNTAEQFLELSVKLARRAEITTPV